MREIKSEASNIKLFRYTYHDYALTLQNIANSCNEDLPLIFN